MCVPAHSFCTFCLQVTIHIHVIDNECTTVDNMIISVTLKRVGGYSEIENGSCV